jgi:hypothetical protein
MLPAVMRARTRTETVVVDLPSPWERLVQSIGQTTNTASPRSRGRFRPGLSGSDVTQVNSDMPSPQRYGGIAAPVARPRETRGNLAGAGLLPLDLGSGSPFAGFAQ